MLREFKTKLGFGQMRLPVDAEGKIDYEQGQKMVDYAYDHDIRYFDTAWMYHGGESEKFIGQALKKYPRDSFTLVSKMPVAMIDSLEQAKDIFKTQLEKCQVEYFDNYLVHAVDHDKWKKTLDLGIFDYLLEEKAAGRIKNLGFSFHDAATELDAIASYYDWDLVQLQLNYYDVAVGDAQLLIDTANKHNLPIVIMEPIRGGFLAKVVPDGKARIEAKLGEGKAPALALSYAFNIPGVYIALSGMSAYEQMVQNVETAYNPIPMDEENTKLIADVVEDIKNFKSVPCTKCRYCMPCPMGLDIPEIFQIYNDWQLFGNAMRTKQAIAKLEMKPGDCVNCQNCMNMCPQHFEIPTLMQEIQAEFDKL